MPSGLGGEAAVTPLREAKAERNRAVRARAVSWVLALIAAFTTLVFVAAWPAAIVAKLILLFVAVGPALLALRSRATARKAASNASAAMERAWLAAAEDVASRSKSGVTSAELAKQLRIEPERAEKLLTELAVHDRTRIDVGDDAEVRYSARPEALAKVRIEDEEDPLVRAIEEAAQDAEAAAHGTRASVKR